MLALILFCFLLNGIMGLPKNEKFEALLPCNFGAYDANSDGVINVDEFMDATHGYTRMNPGTIFDRLDMNHDENILYAEFKKMAPSLQRDHVFDHCKRSWCII
ncbi:uncharacterized protein LOC134277545, partial [Saccostrea cucullata]